MPGRTTTPDPEAPSRPARVSANRIVACAVLAFLIAIVVHGVISLLGGGDSPLRLFVTPFIGATVMFLGLRGYPTAGRIRLSFLVALCLLLFAGAA